MKKLSSHITTHTAESVGITTQNTSGKYESDPKKKTSASLQPAYVYTNTAQGSPVTRSAWDDYVNELEFE